MNLQPVEAMHSAKDPLIKCFNFVINQEPAKKVRIKGKYINVAMIAFFFYVSFKDYSINKTTWDIQLNAESKSYVSNS